MESSTESSNSSAPSSLAIRTASGIGATLELNEKDITYIGIILLGLIQDVTRDILDNQKQMDERWKASIRGALERVIEINLGMN